MCICGHSHTHTHYNSFWPQISTNGYFERFFSGASEINLIFAGFWFPAFPSCFAAVFLVSSNFGFHFRFSEATDPSICTRSCFWCIQFERCPCSNRMECLVKRSERGEQTASPLPHRAKILPRDGNNLIFRGQIVRSLKAREPRPLPEMGEEVLDHLEAI